MWQCVSEIAKARGKSSSKSVLAPLAVAVAVASSPAMAEIKIINADEIHTGSQTHKSHDDTVLIASEYNTQATVTFSNGATGAMTAKGDHANNDYKFISIGHKGKGTLNIDNATVQSADSMIIGAYSHIDTNVSPERVYANGTVNLSNKANLAVNDYLIVGDDGNGTLNVKTSSLATAKEIIIGGGENSTGVINIDGNKFAQGENKTTVHADDKVVIGASGQGTVNVYHDGILSAGKIVVGDEGSAALNVTKGGNVIANNIVREQTAKSATVLLDSADIKVERGNQNNFFAGFTANDRIEFSDGGLEFNTNGFDVTINPNAVIRNVSTKPVDEQIGFVKRGKGTLTMHLDTVDVGDILTIDDGVVKIIGQDHALNGEELRIRLTDANNYGQLLWEGKLDVSKGKLSVQARDAVRQLINNNTAAQWNDVVKATTLSGQFGQFDVVDDNGNSMQNTGLNPVYAGNSVHLKLDGTATPTTPTNPTGKSTGIVTSHQGTQTLTGDYTMQQGDEFRIRLNSATDYGKIAVNGSLDVSKGHLSVQARDAVRQLINNNTAAQWNDVVKATTLSGQFGQFDVVDDNGNSMQNTGLNPVYAGNSVHLKLDGTATPTTPTNPTTPTTPTTPPNVYDFPFHKHFPYNQNPSARNMAPALAHVLASDAKLDGILNLAVNSAKDKEQAAKQLISDLQPTLNAQANNVVYEQQNMITQSINDRIFGARTSTAQGSDGGDARSLFRRSDDLSNQVWAQTFAYDHNLDEQDQLAGYDGNSYGAIVGVDGMLSDYLKLGVALGYAKGDIDSTGTVAKQNLKSDSVQGYVYADYAANDATHLNGFISYGNSNIENERDITVVDAYQAKGEYDSNILQVGIGVDHRIGSEHNHVSPYAQLRFTKISNDAYQESGLPDSLSALHYQAAEQSYKTLRSTLGVHFAKSIGNNTQLIGHLAGHAEQFNNQNTQFAFAGQPDVSFVGSTQERKRFSGSAGLGLRHQLGTATEVSGQYAGEFRSNQQDHGVILQIKHKF